MERLYSEDRKSNRNHKRGGRAAEKYGETGNREKQQTVPKPHLWFPSWEGGAKDAITR
jgi:hypothetical protein